MKTSDAPAEWETYRRELRLHCYRMTGSLQDADDLVQETYLRAWKRLPEFRGESLIRTWLYKIATNACIDLIRKRRRRSLPEQTGGPWNPEKIPVAADENLWLEPFPMEPAATGAKTPEAWYLKHEAVSFAFLTILQELSPRQRAVLILRDVLDWSAQEAAELLGTSVPSVKSALHRARVALAAHAPRGEDMLSPAPANQPAINVLLRKCVKAWESGDMAGLTALLDEEVVLSMPPYRSWYSGKDAVTALLLQHPFGERKRGGWRLVPTWANGETAFGLFRANEPGGSYEAFGLLVLMLKQTRAGLRISKMTVFRNPALVTEYDLSVD